jgi:predicted alpha/beta hydrolase family esterase
MLRIPDTKELYINVSGRLFVVTAVADNDRDANEHLIAHNEQGVIAVVGDLVVMASNNDRGIPARRVIV